MNFSSGAYLTASPRRGVDPRALFMQRTKGSGASPNFLGTLAHGMRLWLKAVGSRSRSQHSAVSRNQQHEITSRRTLLRKKIRSPCRHGPALIGPFQLAVTFTRRRRQGLGAGSGYQAPHSSSSSSRSRSSSSRSSRRRRSGSGSGSAAAVVVVMVRAAVVAGRKSCLDPCSRVLE